MLVRNCIVGAHNAEVYLATDGCIVFSPSTCPSCRGPSGLVASALLMYELVYIAMVRFCVLCNTSYGELPLKHVRSGRHDV